MGLTHDELDDQHEQEFESVTTFLKKHFGDIDVDENEKKVIIKMDGMEASVDCLSYVSAFYCQSLHANNMVICA
jgi:hypothetical protein